MFTECAKGHDLTQPGAYIYKSNGQRECRACNPEAQKQRKKRGLGTWSEKMGKTRNTFA